MKIKLLVSALEASANLHLKPVLEHLSDYELYGIFDQSLGKPYLPSSNFGVMGFVDVVGKIFEAKKAIKHLAKLSLECDAVLLIDSPAFNIPLAKEIRKVNPKAKISYYILPKVWAWKEKRAKVVQSLCDHLCSIFPFEDKFYSKANYVGNPLLDELGVRKQNPSNNSLVAFLPGSRKREIKSLLPIFKNVASQLNAKPILVIPSFFDQETIDEFYGDISEFEISFSTEEALTKSDFAYVCSGTASLEASLIGTPFVLVYKAKWLDYKIGSLFLKLSYVGLANIIFDFAGKKPLHEEFLQEDVNEKKLLDAFYDTDRKKFLQGSQELRKILKHGSAKEVAKILSS